MDVAIPLYDNFTALDAVGPYEVLSSLPDAEVRFLAHQSGPVSDGTGALTLLADGRFEDLPAPDVLVVPGGPGTWEQLGDERLLGWIRRAHGSARYTTSVCSGSLLLAAAGVLEGVEAATHWSVREKLGELGARPVADRVVERGKVITSAGVSAGIDMALRLAELIAGAEIAQAIQLAIEYDPQPPFDTGSLEKAPAEIAALVRQGIRTREAPAT